MTLKKLFLASSSVLVLSAAGALADNNEAYLDQDGDNNTALIQQTGSGANAGGGSPGDMVQNGDNNDIYIMQTGSGTVGTGGNYGHKNKGVDQLGDRNELTINQNYGSRVFEIQQDATGATGTPAAPTNVVTINQTGNMAVSRVNQTYTGDGSAGTENDVTILQTGGQFQLSRVGDSNGFSNEALDGNDRGVFQEGYSNSADITQNGAGHVLLRLEQFGDTNNFDLNQTGGNGNFMSTGLQDGSNNMASLTFDGSDNGKDGFTSGSNADGVNVLASSLTQLGDNNLVNLVTTGNNNQFGFYQDGDDNSATGTQDGNLNEVGVNQTGNINIASFSQNGTGNNAGISQ